MIGFVRFFSKGTQYAYSQYHADFNERVFWHILNTSFTAMVAHAYIFKRTAGNHATIRKKISVLEGLVVVWVMLNMFSFALGDFRAKVEGIPSLQVKAMRYGFNRLTEHEQKNYYGIIQKQIQMNKTVFITESYMNLLLHHLLMLAMFLFTLMVGGILVLTVVLTAEFVRLVDACINKRQYRPFRQLNEFSDLILSLVKAVVSICNQPLRYVESLLFSQEHRQARNHNGAASDLDHLQQMLEAREEEERRRQEIEQRRKEEMELAHEQQRQRTLEELQKQQEKTLKMKINMVNAQREEEKKSKSFGRMFKKAFGFESKPEKTYANYLQRHSVDVEQVMECPICMCDFEPNHKVTGLQCSAAHLYHD